MEIVSLFDTTMSCTIEEVEEKSKIDIKEEIPDFNYDNIDGIIVTEAIDDNAIEVDLVEVDVIDTKKLPRQYQSPEVKQKIIKSIMHKSGKDADVVVVQLENNVKLYQVSQLCMSL
jgi:hypothetical protein